MKQTFKTATVVIAVLLAAMSCTKEIEAPRASEGSLNISIQGVINDLTPAAEVKATAGTVIRANWEEGDTVYVYGGSEYLGALKVSLKDGDARYAYLSNEGFISSPDPSTTKLTLVYASNVTQAPAVIDGQIKIDLSNQDGADFPFVLYGTLDYTDGQGTITDKFVPFEFATSVVKVNCTGLDEELPVSKAELTNINTECVLTLSQKEAATVSADNLDTLARTGEGAFSTADGKAVFQMAVVNTDEATSEEKARTVILTQGEKEFISDFSATALQSGKAYNTICEFRRHSITNINGILCFEALAANSTVSMNSFSAIAHRHPHLEYSTDGIHWDEFIVDSTTVQLENVGDKVWICGDNPTGLSSIEGHLEMGEFFYFVLGGELAASGNVMSLIDKNCEANEVPNAHCFYMLFFNCTALKTAPELPAENLTQGCYFAMFMACSSLVSAPELPAENLEERCYCEMFSGCSSLVSAPELPAKKMATECYEEMFSGCSSLVSAPELPAEILAESCYDSMFAGCKSLKESPKLPAKKLATECYFCMFEDCESLSSITMLATDISARDCLKEWVFCVSKTGTFIKNPEMDNLPFGNSGIPNGWTVKNYGD